MGPAPASAPDRWVYTDGIKRQGGGRGRRQSARDDDSPAGWAVVTIVADRRSGRQVVACARAGRVTTLPGDAEYCGATKHSNNSGELTGLLKAVLEEEARVSGVVEFCVDSTYAINVATGKWRARPANGELARRLRNATRKLIRARGACSVRFRHVRARVSRVMRRRMRWRKRR